MENRENKESSYQTLWDVATTVLIRKLVAIQAHTNKKGPQVSYLTSQLNQLEKEQQRDPKANGRRETVKIPTEINELETKKMIQKIKESKKLVL